MFKFRSKSDQQISAICNYTKENGLDCGNAITTLHIAFAQSITRAVTVSTLQTLTGRDRSSDIALVE